MGLIPAMGLSDMHWGLLNWAGAGRSYVTWPLLRAAALIHACQLRLEDQWWPGRLWVSGDLAAGPQPMLGGTLTVLTGLLQGCPLCTTVPPAPMPRPHNPGGAAQLRTRLTWGNKLAGSQVLLV